MVFGRLRANHPEESIRACSHAYCTFGIVGPTGRDDCFWIVQKTGKRRGRVVTGEIDRRTFFYLIRFDAWSSCFRKQNLVDRCRFSNSAVSWQIITVAVPLDNFCAALQHAKKFADATSSPAHQIPCTSQDRRYSFPIRYSDLPCGIQIKENS